MGRHNRDGRGRDQASCEYEVSYAPDWLSHVNANLLKVKLATAIIGISSIHLLKTFINAPNLDDKTLLWQTVIHMAFVISAVSIAWIDRIMSHHDNKH